MEPAEIIWQELKNLKHGYDDLKKEIFNITRKKHEATQTSRRGALTTSGVTAERVLKYIYRREGKELGGKPADKLMLDDLISELSERSKPSILPHHVVTHLRTVQAWRNLGGHDKGDFNEVNDDTLIGVNIALNTVVSWFFESYLGGEFAELAKNNEINTSTVEISKSLTENEKVWQDYFWFANRNSSIRAIEASYLNSLQVKFNISEERIQNIKSRFQRKIEEFKELIEQALEDQKLEIFEIEAIEYSRETCCISLAEATELIMFSIEKSKIDLSEVSVVNVSWLKDVFETKKSENFIPKIQAENNECEKVVLFELNSSTKLNQDNSAFDDIKINIGEVNTNEIGELIILIDDEYINIYQTNESTFCINFKDRYLQRLDFDFTISHEKIILNSGNTRLQIDQFIGQLSAIKQIDSKFWVETNKSETRYLNQGAGTNSIKISIPTADGKFLPDWKKNLLADDEDKDVSLFIERYPASELEFGFNLVIGKHSKKYRLKFGKYSFNIGMDNLSEFNDENKEVEPLFVYKKNKLGDTIKIQVANKDFDTEMTWKDAKRSCSKLGESWRLPEEKELDLIFNKLFIKNKGGFKKATYWCSNKNKGCQFNLNGMFTELNFNEINIAKYFVRAVRDF